MFKINQILFLFLIISFFSFNSCLIEIPIKPLKVKEITKYGNIQIKEPKDYLENDNINKTILTDEGKSILHQRLLFTANKIGSNNQKFNLVVPKLGSNDIYKLKNHYNPSGSKTSYFTDIHFTKRYGTASCSGYYYIDNIKYINNKNFNLP